MSTSLQDQFLLAMPHLEDANFSGTLTYLCDHGNQGALGVVINRPLDITLGEVMQQLGLDAYQCQASLASVYEGGPVHSDRGFILHTGTADWDASVQITADLCLTTSIDILEAIAKNQGPERFLVALGCASWAEGQLEEEIKDNVWLTCPLDLDILFEIASEHRLQAAANLLGIDFHLMSTQAGHA
ncbi:putative transcriptional regulator [Allopseudospirillum japonicum]|uniref:UPF0301 protein SAMN05421831_11135 n=1 Tax=Allopseudospirillum japonicum TaxID=64971 RepID=A0A1H6TXA4_9GAMM|nr:YqgE/AlgH family protein [Allopseudospirillum japonicum]SEI81867.1 putative transcriptional regulator [Allopseudospirillum japonicum]